MPLQTNCRKPRGDREGGRQEPRRDLVECLNRTATIGAAVAADLTRFSDRKIAARLPTRYPRQVECRMIPNYRDFTIGSIFRGTDQPSTRSAPLIAQWRGCEHPRPIMVFVGIIMPTIYRVRRKSKVNTTGESRSARRFADKPLQAANGVRGKLFSRLGAASKSAGG
jgi:hypothetical protein